MHTFTRRQYLRTGAAAAIGLAVAPGIGSAGGQERFIVDTRNGSVRRLERAGLEVVHDLHQVGLAVVVGSRRTVDRTARTYVRDELTAAELPAVSHFPEEDASDEQFYGFQWDKQALSVPDAHEVTRGEGSTIAVLDTGIDPGHPDIAPALNTALSRNFASDGTGPGTYQDIHWHGTHVSGIAVADDHNDTGVVGIAPGAELIALRVFYFVDLDGDGTLDGPFAFDGDLIAAMLYAADNGADAINMSLGGYERLREARGFYGRVYNRVNTYIARQGTVIVASAGNGSIDLDRDRDGKHSPSGTAATMSVSATGPIGFGWDAGEKEQPPHAPAFYTNYGMSGVDIGAPGGNADLSAIGTGVQWFLDLVFSTIPTWLPAFFPGHGWALGTSMAAPQVAGAVGLLRSEHPDWNANQVRSALERAASVPAGYDKKYYGSGFLNIVDAL